MDNVRCTTALEQAVRGRRPAAGERIFRNLRLCSSSSGFGSEEQGLDQAAWDYEQYLQNDRADLMAPTHHAIQQHVHLVLQGRFPPCWKPQMAESLRVMRYMWMNFVWI